MLNEEISYHLIKDMYILLNRRIIECWVYECLKDQQGDWLRLQEVHSVMSKARLIDCQLINVAKKGLLILTVCKSV